MLNSVLRSPVCKVYFAGFESTTLALQQSGWQLSMQQDISSASCRLAMKHEGTRLYALTHPISDYAAFNLRSPEHLVFNVAYVANDMRFEIMPMSASFKDNWSSIDAMPSFVSSERLTMADIVPFRTVNPDAPEIVIAPSSVPELMDMILKLQDPKQKEIREKARKEAWRRGEPGYHPNEGYSPAADIKAQIIAMPKSA